MNRAALWPQLTSTEISKLLAALNPARSPLVLIPLGDTVTREGK